MTEYLVRFLVGGVVVKRPGNISGPAVLRGR